MNTTKLIFALHHAARERGSPLPHEKALAIAWWYCENIGFAHVSPINPEPHLLAIAKELLRVNCPLGPYEKP